MATLERIDGAAAIHLGRGVRLRTVKAGVLECEDCEAIELLDVSRLDLVIARSQKFAAAHRRCGIRITKKGTGEC